MAEPKWLEQWSGQSTDELLALEGEYRSDSLVLAFEQALQMKEFKQGAASLTAEERVVLAVEALEREVNNGGYGQFFSNAAEYVPVVVDALERMGAAETATLTQEAIDVLRLGDAVTAEAVAGAMEEEIADRDEQLEDCTNRYFQEAGDLAAPLMAFIRRNRNIIALTTN